MGQVVITGAGRCGSSFLVEFLTHMGLDTGFHPENIREHKDPLADGGAGLETIPGSGGPHIVKDMEFRHRAHRILQAGDIEHVIILTRDSAELKASYRRLWARSPWYLRLKLAFKPHQFWINSLATEPLVCRLLYDVVEKVAQYVVPVTLLSHPRAMYEPEYLAAKLGWLIGDDATKIWPAWRAATKGYLP